MRSLVLALLAVVALVGCDPLAPGAAGDLSFPAAETSGYVTLELRFFPDLDGHFDLAGPPALPTNKSEYVQQDSQDLSTISFPYAYSVGGGVGISDNRLWRVVAWLATAATTEWPNGSEPFSTAVVTIDECGGDGYCGTTENVDLALETPATARRQ